MQAYIASRELDGLVVAWPAAKTVSCVKLKLLLLGAYTDQEENVGGSKSVL